MICQNCGLNNATSHFHSVINGVVTDKYLCSKCAQNFKVQSIENNNIFDVLSSFLNDTATVKTSQKKCKCCGITYQEILKNGKLGCSCCYDVFKEELTSMLQRLHGSTNHIGKKISDATFVADNKQDVQEQIEEIKRELSLAIEQEEYEKAAALRDKIRMLEGKE